MQRYIVYGIRLAVIIWTLIWEALARVFQERSDAGNCMSISRMDTDRPAHGFEVKQTCCTDDCQGPEDQLVCVISLPCFEASSQLDFKPVLILFFSPVVAFFCTDFSSVAMCLFDRRAQSSVEWS